MRRSLLLFSTQYSTRVFSRIVTLTFENEDVDEYEYAARIMKTTCKLNNDSDGKENGNTLRTNEWYRNTAQKLSAYTKGLVPVCNNLQWKVRLELARGAELILSKCAE